MRSTAIPVWTWIVTATLCSVLPAADKKDKEPPTPPEVIQVTAAIPLPCGEQTLVYLEGRNEGQQTWRPLDPDYLEVTVSGAARLIEDPAGPVTNPITVQVDQIAHGEANFTLRYVGMTHTASLAVGAAESIGEFSATIDVSEKTHAYRGLGGGVMFFDNQFGISRSGDVLDWCFRDVKTQFLHVLIRPGYEPRNDNDDWKSLVLHEFTFSGLDRPFLIIREALRRNPDLKIYATLYSPPPWLKDNGSTSGEGSLREGIQYRQELAEYVFAYLKHAHSEGIPIHYLGLFNEPDWPHTQDGMYFKDLGVLAETFHDTTAALEELIAADPEVTACPIHVFCDALGPGSITRASKNSEKLVERTALLEPVGVWTVHDYWNTGGDYWNHRFRELRQFPAVGERPIWMSEWAQRFPRGDLASGVEYGEKILNALRLGAEAWMVFEWLHPCGNQSGLISTDWGEHKPGRRYWRSKAYHVFRQVANTTPVGANVVRMSGTWQGESLVHGHQIEYLAVEKGGRLVVHLMNSEPRHVPYRLEVPGAQVGVRRSWLTTPTENLVKAPAPTRDANGAVRGEIPAYSLLTIEMSR